MYVLKTEKQLENVKSVSDLDSFFTVNGRLNINIMICYRLQKGCVLNTYGNIQLYEYVGMKTDMILD